MLHAFWVTACSQIPRDEHDDEQLAARLPKEGYAQLLIRVYKLLLDDFENDEAWRSVEEDWQADSQGLASLMGSLGRSAFGDALFECVMGLTCSPPRPHSHLTQLAPKRHPLFQSIQPIGGDSSRCYGLRRMADMWTMGIGAEEYANWLWELFEALAGVPRPGPARRWKPLDELDFNPSLARGGRGTDDDDDGEGEPNACGKSDRTSLRRGADPRARLARRS